MKKTTFPPLAGSVICFKIKMRAEVRRKGEKVKNTSARGFELLHTPAAHKSSLRENIIFSILIKVSARPDFVSNFP